MKRKSVLMIGVSAAALAVLGGLAVAAPDKYAVKVPVGSGKLDFPDELDRLLLNVAANQAASSLQQSRHLREQRRLASELDERVAQRTAELASANQELERAEHQWRTLLDGIPGMVALLSSTGHLELVNRQVLDYFGQTLEELQGCLGARPDRSSHASAGDAVARSRDGGRSVSRPAAGAGSAARAVLGNRL